MTELKEGLAPPPGDRDTLLALINFSRDGGDASAALEYAEQLAQIAPQDRGLAALIEELRRQVGSRVRNDLSDRGVAQWANLLQCMSLVMALFIRADCPPACPLSEV